MSRVCLPKSVRLLILAADVRFCAAHSWSQQNWFTMNFRPPWERDPNPPVLYEDTQVVLPYPSDAPARWAWPWPELLKRKLHACLKHNVLYSDSVYTECFFSYTVNTAKKTHPRIIGAVPPTSLRGVLYPDRSPEVEDRIGATGERHKDWCPNCPMISVNLRIKPWTKMYTMIYTMVVYWCILWYIVMWKPYLISRFYSRMT